MQPIQQPPAACIGQSAKHSVLFHASNMEPFSSLTIGNRLVACQAKNPRACLGDTPGSREPSPDHVDGIDGHGARPELDGIFRYSKLLAGLRFPL